jgi:hypothetical protein
MQKDNENNEIISDIKKHLDIINHSLKCISNYKTNDFEIELNLKDVCQDVQIDAANVKWILNIPYRIEAIIKQVI